MRVVLKFDLSNEDEKQDYTDAMAGKHLKLAMWEFSQEILRKYRKYDLPIELDTPEKLVSHIEQEFYRILKDYEVSID